MYDILSAVLYCHKEQIVHRDLKPENVIFESDENDAPIKVIDFGFSIKQNKVRKFKSVKGSPYYMAPEVLKGNYDEKCDVWSCGVILYMMLSGTPPFNGKSDNEIYQSILKGNFTFQKR
mmetsp:Transcript_22866/g.3759  ORF Transcript_22866/g.3759 Transcript_22866/m.3759 type:complete len:119 (+) Transcript_22866:534-890(+)